MFPSMTKGEIDYQGYHWWQTINDKGRQRMMIWKGINIDDIIIEAIIDKGILMTWHNMTWALGHQMGMDDFKNPLDLYV